MARYVCRYFLSIASLLDDDRVPDSVYRRYEKLLKRSYEESGTAYAPIQPNNEDLAQLWNCNDPAVRDCLRQMRALGLIDTEQVGRYERKISLLVAWRGNGSDSAADINAAAERAPHLEAQATATGAPAQPAVELSSKSDDLDEGGRKSVTLDSEGARKSRTLKGAPNVVVGTNKDQDLFDIHNNNNPTNPAFEGARKSRTLDSEGARKSRTLDSEGARKSRTLGDENNLAKILDLLDRIVIAEPKRSLIAVLPHMTYDYLLPWTHYAEDNPDLGGGYFVTRFEKNALAPTAYREHAARREREREREERERAEQQTRYDAEIAEMREADNDDNVPCAQYAPTHADVWGNAHDVWHATLGELQQQLTRATFDTWVRPSRALGWEDGNGDTPTLVVGAHSPYAKEWLEARLNTTIQRTVTGIAGRSVDIRYEVADHSAVRTAAAPEETA